MARKPKTKPEKRRPPPGRPFRKGVSGNPGGRPKVLVEVLAKHRERVDDLLEALYRIATKDKSRRTRVAAAKEFLDRVIGKPAQAIQLTGANGGPVRTATEVEVKDAAGTPSPAERTAAILGVLVRVGAIPPVGGVVPVPAPGGASGAGEGDHPAPEQVHPSGSDPAPGGVPSPGL